MSVTKLCLDCGKPYNVARSTDDGCPRCKPKPIHNAASSMTAPMKPANETPPRYPERCWVAYCSNDNQLIASRSFVGQAYTHISKEEHEALLAEERGKFDAMALTCLAEISGAGFCTPQEGYREAPHLLAGDLRSLTAKITALQAEVERLREALKDIADKKGKTMFGSCCVEERCTPEYDENGKKEFHCTHTHGVNRGYEECAGIARAALSSPSKGAQGVWREKPVTYQHDCSASTYEDCEGKWRCNLCFNEVAAKQSPDAPGRE